ncbi:MAG: response regulator [Thiogranum sp.]
MILLVEDSEDDAALMLRVLGKQLADSRIRVARDGSEALELLANWGNEELHLILLDVHLPRVSGLEVLEELRKSPFTRHVPVVMLSGSQDNNDVIRSYDLGANSFLVKAGQAEQFEATMHEIIPYWLHLNHAFPLPGATAG